MRFLDARIHGTLDIVIVLLLLIGPFLFGLGGSPAAIAWTFGLLHLVLILLTRYPLGRWKTVPLFVHGIFELVEGALLVAMPSIDGYSPGSPAKRFYTIVGVFVLVVWALSAYREPAREVAA